MRIAYISCHNYGQYSVGYIDEETALLVFLREKGLNIERCTWNDADVDWKEYDLVIGANSEIKSGIHNETKGLASRSVFICIAILLY